MQGVRFRDFTHLLGQIYGSNTYVDVWNCQATFIIAGKSEDELELTEKQKEALEKLKNYVIYTVNDGAINFSGHYQLDDVAFSVLREILSTTNEEIIDAMIEAISTPTPQEIQEKAKEIIEVMEEGDYVVVYDSGLNCWEGCQGYHNIQYVVFHNGKYILTDNGQAHHAYCQGCEAWVVLKELSREEAIKRLAEYIDKVAEKYNYTKVELENYQLDSEAERAKLLFCEKHKRFFFDYEGCLECYSEEVTSNANL